MFQSLRLLPHLNLLVVQASDISNSLPKSENVRDVCLDCFDLICQLQTPASRARAYCDCNPIRAFETFNISRVVIGSTLSKGWRSGPEAFRAGHFLRLDRNRKPRMKSLWNPGYFISYDCQKTDNCYEDGSFTQIEVSMFSSLKHMERKKSNKNQWLQLAFV